MTDQAPKPWEKLTSQLEVYLDQALALKVELSSDDSAYDIQYIQQKLAKISSVTETLSDYCMQTTKLHLELVRMAADARERLRVQEAIHRDSETYKGLPREEKTPWLTGQLAVYRDMQEGWSQALLVSKEVREALAARIQVVKRLDSDLRLHEKLLDVGVGAGAFGSPPTQGPGEEKQAPQATSVGNEIHLT